MLQASRDRSIVLASMIPIAEDLAAIAALKAPAERHPSLAAILPRVGAEAVPVAIVEARAADSAAVVIVVAGVLAAIVAEAQEVLRAPALGIGEVVAAAVCMAPFT
jgi:hypothetical protein